jgi:hypothetical protein
VRNRKIKDDPEFITFKKFKKDPSGYFESVPEKLQS